MLSMICCIFLHVTYLSHVIKGIFPEQYDSSLHSQAIQSYSGRKVAECMRESLGTSLKLASHLARFILALW